MSIPPGPYVLDPTLGGESWKLGHRRRQGPLTEEKLRMAMEKRREIRVGPRAHERLQRLLQGMDGTMTPEQRRRTLEGRRRRLEEKRRPPVVSESEIS